MGRKLTFNIFNRFPRLLPTRVFLIPQKHYLHSACLKKNPVHVQFQLRLRELDLLSSSRYWDKNNWCFFPSSQVSNDVPYYSRQNKRHYLNCTYNSHPLKIITIQILEEQFSFFKDNRNQKKKSHIHSDLKQQKTIIPNILHMP